MFDHTGIVLLKMVRRKFGNLVLKVIYQISPLPNGLRRFNLTFKTSSLGNPFDWHLLTSRLGPTRVIGTPFDHVLLTLYDATIVF